MINIATIGLLAILNVSTNAQDPPKHIEEHGMQVSWHFENDRIHFEVSAPTTGWVTIGFNPTEDITGAYLLMGRVTQGQAEVIEHYTSSPGRYAPITELGATAQVQHVKGKETDAAISLSFSVPINALSKFQQDLLPRSQRTMILAYSQEDDFQHHSIMRTSVKVQL